MKRRIYLLLLTGVICVANCRWIHADEAPARIVTISTLCFLDDLECRTDLYVLGQIETAAQRQQHDLIVTPCMPFLSFREGHEKTDLARFASLAKTHATYLAIALTETGTSDQTFLTSVLFGRSGQIVGKYRKTHTLADDTITLGDALPVFETDFGVLGMSLTTDFYFPEVYAVQRMKGADILLWQHYPERFREHFQWIPLLKARALDSHAHFVTAMYADPRTYLANRYVQGMQGAAWGRSMILNRVGTPLADTGYEDGVATSVINLDKRKREVHPPWYAAENIFFCNCLGDRKAFQPIAQRWKKPTLPAFRKRKARVAVGYFWHQDAWHNDRVPEVMFRVLDAAAECRPDIVLLSEMGAKIENETTQQVAKMVGDWARQMKAYVIIGGLGDKDQISIARVWDRQGRQIFEAPIYWTKGFPELKVFDTDFARIGIHTCGDLYTGEIDRVLALKGAEIIFDPSQHWGADGRNNELMLRARAIDNGCWVACAHWNSSDPGFRSLIIDPYGYVMAASHFQQEGVVFVDIDFEQQKVYYAGRKDPQPQRGDTDIAAYVTGDVPQQRAGWRDFIFARRRPKLYGIIPTTNEVIMRYRPDKGPWK